jgi:serine/threonine protein kinase
VLDFGLAKRFEPASGSPNAATLTMAAETGAGQLLGTIAYMSPEQAECRPLTASSDIFSFGVLLYEMLAGERPFRGDTTLSTLASILRDEPSSLRAQRPEVPAGVERVVLRCLAKDPKDRYVSAAEVQLALGEFRRPEASGAAIRRLIWASLAIFLVAALAAGGAAWYLQSSGSDGLRRPDCRRPREWWTACSPWQR